MKILNLYAGIGGNRKLWGKDHEITAIEYDESIAAIYKDLHPSDNVIVADAHEYLLNNFQDFDFIWSSPPCQTHSVLNYSGRSRGDGGKFKYPDMKLYQEIILLSTFFKGKYVVENVKSYYKPLLPPQGSGRHYFWANFKIPNIEKSEGVRNDAGKNLKFKMIDRGFNIDNWHGYKKDKRQLLNNCVSPEIGKSILDNAFIEQRDLFYNLEIRNGQPSMETDVWRGGKI